MIKSEQRAERTTIRMPVMDYNGFPKAPYVRNKVRTTKWNLYQQLRRISVLFLLFLVVLQPFLRFEAAGQDVRIILAKGEASSSVLTQYGTLNQLLDGLADTSLSEACTWSPQNQGYTQFGSSLQYQQSIQSYPSSGVVDWAPSARWERTLWNKPKLRDVVLHGDSYHTILRYQDPSPGDQNQEFVTINELLLRGCSTRNMSWAIGLVLNKGETLSKLSGIDNFNLVNFIILTITSLVAARHGSGARRSAAYLDLNLDHISSYIDNAFIIFNSCLIALQNIVPASLYSSIKIDKKDALTGHPLYVPGATLAKMFTVLPSRTPGGQLGDATFHFISDSDLPLAPLAHSGSTPLSPSPRPLLHHVEREPPQTPVTQTSDADLQANLDLFANHRGFEANTPLPVDSPSPMPPSDGGQIPVGGDPSSRIKERVAAAIACSGLISTVSQAFVCSDELLATPNFLQTCRVMGTFRVCSLLIHAAAVLTAFAILCMSQNGGNAMSLRYLHSFWTVSFVVGLSCMVIQASLYSWVNGDLASSIVIAILGLFCSVPVLVVSLHWYPRTPASHGEDGNP